MKNIKKGNSNGLPTLRKLKNTPNWLESYPDFMDKIEELWNNDQSFATTLGYFMTNGKINENTSWKEAREEFKNLYHK